MIEPAPKIGLYQNGFANKIPLGGIAKAILLFFPTKNHAKCEGWASDHRARKRCPAPIFGTTRLAILNNQKSIVMGIVVGGEPQTGLFLGLSLRHKVSCPKWYQVRAQIAD